MDWLMNAPVIVLTALVIAVSVFDLRERRIPNFLVLPGAMLGLGFNFWLRGWTGLGFGLKGLAAGFCLLILPYAVGGMKAGDVKFLSAIGAFTGPADVFRALLATLLCYPLMAIVAVVREKKVRLTWLRFRRVFFNFLGFFAPPMKLFAANLEGRDDPGVASVTTPFGVAIAAGALIAAYTDFLR
ncbi:MAG: prepilin peptidase [Blastocatellia bacterium]